MISRQIAMILMYVSSQTVPESTIEDDGTKNNHVLDIYKIKILQNIFFQPIDICRISLQFTMLSKEDKKIKKCINPHFYNK